MSRISDKIAYTANAIDDIQAALEERGFDMDGIALRLYGGLIRSIKTSSYYEEIVDEDGFAHNIIRNRFDNAIIINNLNDGPSQFIQHGIERPIVISNDLNISMGSNVPLEYSNIIDNDAIVYHNIEFKEGE